jgi:DNA-binding LacI/PurR family transcriptional regulator
LQDGKLGYNSFMDKKAAQDNPKPVTLKVLAEYLDLSPATVSIVLNNSPVAKSIATATRQRVLAAAVKFKYRANVHARMLRTRLSNTIGVMVPELSEGYFTTVMSGVEQCLLQEGYLSYTVSHLYRPDLIEEYPQLLMDRSIDGLLVVNTELRHKLPIPAVGISAHSRIAGVSNIELDHTRAAGKALRHLHDLGHRRIAFMKGQPFVPDTELRWTAILATAQELGLLVRPELCLYLQQTSLSAEIGYQPVRELLARTRDFTAIFCFNDLAAIGAIRAIEDVGLHCPADISVIGFDDIGAARFYNPRLTTISQPLYLMGQTAAKLLITRIQSPNEAYPEVVTFEPELVVRESAAGLHQPRPLRARKVSKKSAVTSKRSVV